MPRLKTQTLRNYTEPQAGPGNGVDLAALIHEAERSNAELLGALESLQRRERVNDQLVIASAMRALGRCLEAEGLSPSAREQVRSAHKMCRASMGLP